LESKNNILPMYAALFAVVSNPLLFSEVLS